MSNVQGWTGDLTGGSSYDGTSRDDEVIGLTGSNICEGGHKGRVLGHSVNSWVHGDWGESEVTLE